MRTLSIRSFHGGSPRINDPSFDIPTIISDMPVILNDNPRQVTAIMSDVDRQSTDGQAKA
jgi:hypothetical protein